MKIIVVHCRKYLSDKKESVDMLKRFLVAAIVGLLMLTSQIAAAEDYDWNQAKRISTKAAFYRYVEDERRRGQTLFHVVIINHSILPNAWQIGYIDKNDFADIIPCRDYEPRYTHIDNDGMKMEFNVIEYPGTRVANVYLNGGNLTGDDWILYNEAIEIVNEVNKFLSEKEKAKYIHDAICNRVKDYKNENDRNKTAIGALIDGYAHCQGFTDAFYMLGRMAGLNVGRIGGFINSGGKHMWNTITFNDGKTYCVDVTNDYLNNSNDFFCANKEFMQKYFSCHWEIIPNLQ